MQLAVAGADEFVHMLGVTVVPFDRGGLSKGIRRGNPRVSGTTIEIDVESTARSDEGFDYPEYIDRVAKVLPTRRKVLRWYGRGGQPIFSRGFVNPNRRWWKKAVTTARWKSALLRAKVFG